MKLSPWGSSLSQVYDTTNQFPLPDHGNFAVHDPNILKHNSEYYLFRGGHHIPIYKATDLNGPWMQIGTVLDSDSVIHVGNRSRPWAPTTIEKNGIFYCFYTVSSHGSRESAIGVATTTTLDGSPWIDHGAVVQSAGSDVWPFNITNTIDASFITDQTTGKFYLNFGSFWHDIWQVPLADNLLSIEDPKNPDAVQLTFIPGQKVRPQEGSFMSYRDGWYYVWFSHGKCCHFYKGFPEKGMEYSIRVGRSRNVRGPFVDKHDRLLVESGGTVVYGSNHGLVYAPGGIGVLSGEGSASDILYYHYLNTTIGFKNKVSLFLCFAMEELVYGLGLTVTGCPSRLELGQVREWMACCSGRRACQCQSW